MVALLTLTVAGHDKLPPGLGDVSYPRQSAFLAGRIRCTHGESEAAVHEPDPVEVSEEEHEV